MGAGEPENRENPEEAETDRGGGCPPPLTRLSEESFALRKEERERGSEE